MSLEIIKKMHHYDCTLSFYTRAQKEIYLQSSPEGF